MRIEYHTCYGYDRFSHWFSCRIAVTGCGILSALQQLPQSIQKAENTIHTIAQSVGRGEGKTTLPLTGTQNGSGKTRFFPDTESADERAF